MAGPRTVVNVAALRRVRAELARRGGAAARASRLSVTVGIHEEEGGEEDASGTTVASIAFFHEVGTSRVRRRSWLVDGIAENLEAIQEAQRRVARAIVQKNPVPVDRAYLQLGEFIVTKLKARIVAGIPPALLPATLLKKTVGGKGGATPLIDEGRLLASITAQVREF